MKKNMLSILILALLIVNIVLTAIMMFSITGTAKKTSALIDDISAAINLDLKNQSATSTEAVVADKKEPTPPAPPVNPMGGGMY